MDEITLDSEYLKQLKPSFLHLFMNFVKPCNVISLFHTYNINVLTEIDVENIKTLSDKKGEREGSMLLFERLVLYKGWYTCLLQVLRDRDACLSHVAHEMEVIKGLLDEKILSEESDDQTQTTVEWLAGMSVLTSGLTTVLRVTLHTKNLSNLKVDPILEMRSLKLKIELERLKKELEEVKQNVMERNQSFEQQHLEANSVLSSDSSDVDQLAGKMCELCKSSKEMLKQNEILQTELREAYSDSKAFCEKLNQEKEKLQTEFDHLKKEFSDRKDSYEKLHQEKDFQDDLLTRKLNNQENQTKIEEMKRKQEEDLNMHLEKLRIASEQEKSAILQKMQDSENAAKNREERIITEYNEKIKKAREEDEKRWQERIRTLQETHDKQLVTLRKQLTDTAMQQKFKELTEMQINARPPMKDPYNMEIRCVDQQGKYTIVELNKYDQMALLMRAYCDKYDYQMSTLKFMYNGDRVMEDDTPDRIGLEDGDTLDVFFMQPY